MISISDWSQTAIELILGVVPGDRILKIGFGDWFGYALELYNKAQRGGISKID